MTKLKAFWYSTRPKTLWASAFPVISSFLLALKQKLENPSLSLPIFLGLGASCLIIAILAQIISNFINDANDYEKNRDILRTQALRPIHKGEITSLDLKRGAKVLVALTLIFGSFIFIFGYHRFVNIFLAASIFLGAYGYSQGRFAFSLRGLGEVAAFVFFGPVAFFGTLGVLYPQEQLLFFLPKGLLLSSLWGLMSVFLMMANNYRDYNEDFQVSKKTLAVIMGPTYYKFLGLFLLCFFEFCLALIFWPLCLCSLFLFLFLPIPLFPKILFHHLSIGLLVFLVQLYDIFK